MTVRVAAVQMPFAWASTPQEFFERIRDPVERAAQAGARLVALPQHLGDMLVGIQIPVAHDATWHDVCAAGGFRNWADCVRQTGQTTAEFYVHAFDTLSRQFQLYIAAGTISLPEPGEVRSGSIPEAVYRASYLFAPDGSIIGEQRQMRGAVGIEHDGLALGESVTARPTHVGMVGLIVGDDVLHSDIAHVLLLQGAKILINSMARTSTGDVERPGALRNVAEANFVFGIESPLAGGGYAGRASIYAPLALTPSGNGVLAEALLPDQPQVVVADLDMPGLDAQASKTWRSLSVIAEAGDRGRCSG